MQREKEREREKSRSERVQRTKTQRNEPEPRRVEPCRNRYVQNAENQPRNQENVNQRQKTVQQQCSRNCRKPEHIKVDAEPGNGTVCSARKRTERRWWQNQKPTAVGRNQNGEPWCRCR